MSTEAKPLQHNDKEEHKKLPISFTAVFSSQPYDDHCQNYIHYVLGVATVTKNSVQRDGTFKLL